MTTKITVNTQIALEFKQGNVPDTAGLLSWIQHCLNCNTNRVEVKVEAANMNSAIPFCGGSEAVIEAVSQADAHLNNVGLPSYLDLVTSLRDSMRLLGLVDDIGTATGGLSHPDDQNRTLDAGAALLARIPTPSALVASK